MCFQQHSSLSCRLGDTEHQVATLVSSSLLGAGFLWLERTAKHTAVAGKNDDSIETIPAGLLAGTNQIDRQSHAIPANELPQIEESGL